MLNKEQRVLWLYGILVFLISAIQVITVFADEFPPMG